MIFSHRRDQVRLIHLFGESGLSHHRTANGNPVMQTDLFGIVRHHHFVDIAVDRSLHAGVPGVEIAFHIVAPIVAVLRVVEEIGGRFFDRQVVIS